jgi:hypothetical protein
MRSRSGGERGTGHCIICSSVSGGRRKVVMSHAGNTPTHHPEVRPRRRFESQVRLPNVTGRWTITRNEGVSELRVSDG